MATAVSNIAFYKKRQEWWPVVLPSNIDDYSSPCMKVKLFLPDRNQILIKSIVVRDSKRLKIITGSFLLELIESIEQHSQECESGERAYLRRRIVIFCKLVKYLRVFHHWNLSLCDAILKESWDSIREAELKDEAWLRFYLQR